MAGVGVAVATALAIAAPAAAEADLEVDAGYVDGQIVPGRSAPVRVQVRSDQLLTGTLTVTPYTLGTAGEAVSTPVEVAGGSVEEYLVAMPTRWDGEIGPAEVRVELRAGDETVEASDTLAWNGSTEVVGLTPGLVSQAPEPVDLAMDLGRAVFDQLDELELATPGALGPLGTIVTGPDGISALPAEAQRNVLDWVESGGQLLVDAPPGTPVTGVPEAWQPAGSRAPAGDGWVRLTDGAAARGQWASIVEPTRQFGPAAMAGGGMCCFPGIPDSVARDSGLRIPELGWLLAFLIAYVVIVGPLTFVVLRRARRTGLAWVAIPVVAVLFTGVAFTAGSNLRSGAKAAHGSLVETSPLGDRAVSYVGLVSRDGGDPTAVFPEGWDAGGFDPRTAAGGMVFEGPTVAGGGSQAVAVQGDDGRPGVRLPLSAGDFGMVTGRGRIDGGSPLAVTATAAADGSVSGTVTNAAAFDLQRVIVVVAGEVADVGDLPAGSEAEWTLDAADDGPPDDPWQAVERPWSDAIGDMGEANLDSVVNYSVYAAEVGSDIDAYRPGTAVAAGWTTGWAPPVDVGSGVGEGRTGVVASTAVAAAPGTVPAAAVRREFVRGPGATRFDPPVQIPDWGEARAAVARFTLPAGADPATPLVLDASAGVAQAEVWSGGAWVPLELVAGADPPPVLAPGDAGAQPATDGAVVIQGGADPFGPPRVARIPAGAAAGGAVYVRVAVVPDGSRIDLQVRGAA